MQLKGFKKVYWVFAALFAALFLTGCGAGIECAYYSDSQFYYYDLRVSVSQERMAQMEKTAAYNPSAYGKWTFSDYLYGLAQRLTFSDGTRFEFVSEGNTASAHVMNFTRKIPKSTVSSGGGEEDENYALVRKNFFYVYQTTVTVSHPFNGLRAQYDGAQVAHADMMSVIRYGLTAIGPSGEVITYYPSLYDAFPALQGTDVSDFTLAYLIPAPKSGSSTGETVVLDGVRFFRFDRAFTSDEETITYRYYSGNSVGWYVTAIVLGALVTGLILLFTRRNRKKRLPQTQELFPYDPFREESGETLPTGYNEPKNGGFRY